MVKFLRKRQEQKSPLKLHCLSLHKLKLQNVLKFRESTLIKKDCKSKLWGKEKSNGTSGHRFVRINITAKTMKRQKMQIRTINVWM